jgi:hypothetical protein
VTIDTPLESTPYAESVVDMTSEESNVRAPRLAQAVPSADARTADSPSLSSVSGATPLPTTHTAQQRVRFEARLGEMIYQLLSSPHTILAAIYLILACVVVVMLAFAIVVEWRRQHPTQIAYGVGLMAAMFVLMTVHLTLTSGAVVI